MSIREVRETCCWTLEELAIATGLDVQTIIECENNSKHKNPWAMSIILEILGLDYDNTTI